MFRQKKQVLNNYFISHKRHTNTVGTCPVNKLTILPVKKKSNDHSMKSELKLKYCVFFLNEIIPRHDITGIVNLAELVTKCTCNCFY